MGVQVYIPTEEVWEFFQENKEKLASRMYAVAENSDTGYTLYITEDQGLPFFSVCKDEEPPEYEEGAVTANDCMNTVKRLSVRYLLPVMVVGDKADEEEPEDETYILTRQDAEDEQYVREDDLRLAICDFLNIALEIDGFSVDAINEFGEDLIDEILEDFLERLATVYEFEIYRPKIIYDEDIGADVLDEFPYNDDVDASFVIGEEIEYSDDGGGYS